ncbi:hypothetical protein [Streptomyces sp. NPDC020742]|uniref:hypothetical protein n=1 Tax=unclassified Streptomyces TaxID=2593676 RepID=UPI0033CB1C56
MVAPGFRSRIATGLLFAAVVLPVPTGATPAAALDRQATPAGLPPNLVRPGDTPDDSPPDDLGPEALAPQSLTPDDFGAYDRLGGLPDEGRFGLGPGGRFRDLPDRYGPPYGPGRFPHRWHRHYGEGRWHHHPHHPFGPGFDGPGGPDDGRYSDDYGPDERRPDRSHGADRAHPRRPASPKGHAAASEPPATAPARRSPMRRVDIAERRSMHPYETLPPLPAPSGAEKASPSPGGTEGEAAEPGPYAMETPGAPVERVLPMGAGLALTGLGLAFLGLRLRRR